MCGTVCVLPLAVTQAVTQAVTLFLHMRVS